MCIVQAPAGASLEYTTEIAKKAEQIIYADKDVAAAFSVMGFSFSGAAPNNGMIFIRLKDYDERQGKDQSLQAVLQRLSGPLFMIPGAIVAAFPPPSIQGLWRVRRLPVRSARSNRLDRHQHARRRDVRHDGRGQPERPGAGRVQQLPRRRSAVDRRHRSRQGAQPRPAAARSHRRAAGVPRLAVRQRLRLQQPRLSRLRAGGSAVPRQPGEPEAAVCARVERRHDPARHRRAAARDDGAAGDQPLQPVPLGGDHRQPRAGQELGPDARGDGGAGARRTCRRASTSRGRGSRSKSGGPAGRPD